MPAMPTMPKQHAPRETTLGQVATSDPGRFLRLSVSYDLGGLNHFAGAYEPRGYWLMIKIITRTDWGYSYSPTEGCRILLEETPRFSPKRLAELAKSVCLDDYRHSIDLVLAQARLTLQ